MGGRSFKAKIVSVYLRANRMTVKSSNEDLKDNKDKMIYKIEDDSKFPYPVTKRMCNKMEVIESPGDGKSKLTFMYIHGGAYYHQFSKFH